MPDLLTTSEFALTTLGLAYYQGHNRVKRQIDVIIGGLGLSPGVEAVLKDNSVSSILVIEILQVIIGWHKKGLLPIGKTLCADPQCQLVCSDFFVCARIGICSDSAQPNRLFNAILIDIDHTPNFHLMTKNAGFHNTAGLT